MKLPPQVKIAVTAEAHIPYQVTVYASLVDGRYICSRVDAERKPNGVPITVEGLAALPLARIVAGGLGKFIGHEVAALSDELSLTAAAYRLAQLCGQSPLEAVEAVVGQTEYTAAERIEQARLAGLIETDTGDAGTGPGPGTQEGRSPLAV